MDMGMGSGMGGGGMDMPLNHTGVNFNDPDQASNFLSELLDDAELQITGNQYALYFLFGVVVVIFLATVLNVGRWLTLRQRLRLASANRTTPAKPKSPWHRAIATVTAIGREASYPQWTPLQAAFWVKVPPVGILLLVATHFAYVIALEFTGVDPAMYGDQYYTALSIKAAWLAIAQVPLLILLAGKNNLIGLLTGVSYERLNVLHRWTARVLLLMATVHFGTENFVWNRFGILQLEWTTDTCPPTGIAAYAILLWLNLSTVAPLRNLWYEFFVIQHLITFFGFIIALMLHLPTTALESRIWIYVPIGLYIVDRLIRFGHYVWNNARGSKANLEQMEGGVTKVRVSNEAIKKWSPGSFVLLCLPRMCPGQSHPATIASTPDSHNGDLVFILKSHSGFTGKLGRVASVDSAKMLDAEHGNRGEQPRVALIDGPYGSHDDFAAFDSTVLIAGATGVTFTLPILLDIAHRSSTHQLPVRRLTFVWLIKGRECLDWIAPEFLAALPKLRGAGIELNVQICVTCDDGVTDAELYPFGPRHPGCTCDTKLGPCCCTTLSDDEGSRNNSYTSPTSSEGAAKEKETTLQRMRAEGVKVSSGRCDVTKVLSDQADQADGEMGVAVCGPLGLSTCVRRKVAWLSDERGIHKGTGAQGIYLHVEGFAF